MIMLYPKNKQELIPKNSSSKFWPSNWQNPEKKVENDENSNFDKFGCRGHSAFESGAKHI